MPLLFACGEAGDPPVDEPAVTYSNQISRLMQEHCEGCHRPEGLAPFPLVSYEDAASRAELIEDAVVSQRMPHGVSMRLGTGCAEPDTFEGPRRLTPDEIDLVSTWVALGAPEGDPAQLPPPRSYPSGEWAMGDPDFETANAADGFTLPASLQRDVFRRFVVATDFEGDRFLTGFEALPDTVGGAGLEHVVHHVTLFVNPGAEAFQQEAEFAASDPEVPGPGFEGAFTYPVQLVGMWFPGSAPLELPEGVGVRVPQGSALVFEVHYSPTQEVVTDQTRIGLRLQTEVAREIEPGLVKNEDFVVPAGDPAFGVDAERSFDQELTLYSITPHQHQLGTDFRVLIDRPGQETTCLADVEWDFEHQATYRLREPLTLPAGSTIRVACTYDNSADNPHQFNDPPVDVPFGAFADHEMCQLTIGAEAGALAAPAAAPELVEVLYNPEGDDAVAEWIKLRNPGTSPIDLSDYSVGWGGTDYTYGALDLSGTLAPGECLIVGAVPDGMTGAPADFVPDLQNAGSVADGVAVFRGAAADITSSSIPVDAVIYGGSNDNGLRGPGGGAAQVDTADAPAGDSIQKTGDGWVVGAPQPGACP